MPTKTPNLELTEVQDADVGPGAAASFDNSFDKLDALVQLSVVSRTTTVSPLSPNQGDRYIVPATGVAFGDPWFNFPRRIAYASAAGWIFFTPRPGWEAIVQDESSGSPQVIARAVYLGANWVDATVTNTGGGGGGGGGGTGGGNVTPDTHPAIANAMDDEFETGTVIDTSKWTVFGGTSANWPVTYGSVIGKTGTVVAVQTLPPAPWHFRAKCFVSANNQQGGLVVGNRTTLKAYNLFQYSGGECVTQLGTITSSWAYTFNTNLQINGVVQIAYGPVYVDCTYDGTSLTAGFSNSGYEGSFSFCTPVTPASSLGGQPLEIGLGLSGAGCSWDWFRRLA